MWNIPAGMTASLVSATAGPLLPLLHLFGGLLAWTVTLTAVPGARDVPVGPRGWFGFLSGLP